MKDQFLGIDLDPQFPGNSARIFSFDARHHIVKDLVSGTLFSQTYAGTNRTRITAANVQEVVPINTPVIDHVGTSLTPALRLEPAAANILLEVVTDWTKSAGTTVTKDAASWQGAANGAWTIVAGGANATVVSTAVSATSAEFTFVCAMKRSVGTGAVYMTIDNGSTWTEKTLTTSYQYFNVTKTAANPQLGFKLATSGDEIIVDCLMLVPNTAIASIYFAPAAAIGSELVTNGDFSAVTEGAAINSGLFTVGNCYKIASHTDSDFTTVGAPDSNIGTYFNATATGGAGILDAGDTVNPITFTNWAVTPGTGIAPQAVAGSLTGKVSCIPYGATTRAFSQTNAGLAASKAYRIMGTATCSAGTYFIGVVGMSAVGTGYIDTTGTVVAYPISTALTGTVTIYFSAAANVVLDDVSVKEHGTVRASEAGTIQIATDADLAAALSGSFTVAMKIRFPMAKTSVSAASTLFTTLNTANTGIYHTSAGVFTVSDGTNTATNDDAFVANTDYILVWRGKAATSKMDVGFGIPGAVSFDAEGDYDGAVATTGDITYLMHTIGRGGAHIYWANAWNKELTAAQVNALR